MLEALRLPVAPVELERWTRPGLPDGERLHARAYLFAGEIGACLHNPAVAPEDSQSYTRDDTGYREFMVKLRHVKDHMLTNEGRRLALERHHFMEEFFARFIREFEGKL